MRKQFKTVCVAVASIMVIGLVTYDSVLPKQVMAVGQGDVNNAQDDVNESKKKLEQLQNDLQAINADIVGMKDYILQLDGMTQEYTNKLVEVQNQIAAKQNEIAAKQNEIAAKQSEITAKEVDIEAAQQLLAQTESEKVAQYDAMKLRIQYMYETGEQTFMDMLFSADGLSDLLSKAEYIDSITSYDRKMLEKLSGTIDDINGIVEQLKADKDELETAKLELEEQNKQLVVQENALIDMQTNLQNQQNAVDIILAEKQKVLIDLENKQQYTDAEIANAQREYEENERIAAQIKAQYEEELRKAKEEAEKNNQPEQTAAKTLEEIGLNGGFTWPLPGYNYITSEWGMRFHPVLHYNTLHDGFDISGGGVYGKPILAAYSGTVSIADSRNSATGYGYYVKIDHGVGVSTIYAHMSLINCTEGQHVEAGQVIGYVGSTGNSTGPHLHFSVFIQGESKNPRDYITIP